MDKPAVILGKRIVGRKEALEYLAKKNNWQNAVVGISAFFGFWAWVIGRLTGRKVVYYCIDFYSPHIATSMLDALFIKCAMLMDKFLVYHCDELWDISERINEGRWEFGKYSSTSKIVPLCYPPSYFRFETDTYKDIVAFVGLVPYGLELIEDVKWLKDLPLDRLLLQLSYCGIGLSIWEDKGNNYYGDPGKTKLYSACGLPVIMTDNTPYAEIIKKTNAGIIIDYNKEELQDAIAEIIRNYSFYKNNVKKTWEYINADIIGHNLLLD